MLKKLLAAGALTAAAAGAALTASPAYAHDGVTTSGDGGILSGTQILNDVNIGVNVCGNAIAVLGVANAVCHGGDAEVHD